MLHEAASFFVLDKVNKCSLKEGRDVNKRENY